MPPCPLGFVPATLVTAANMHDTQPVAALLPLATQDGWSVGRVKVDGIHVGPRMAQAAADHEVDIQVTTRECHEKGFRPLPLRWRIDATSARRATAGTTSPEPSTGHCSGNHAKPDQPPTT